jgi:hypothetical protein
MRTDGTAVFVTIFCDEWRLDWLLLRNATGRGVSHDPHAYCVVSGGSKKFVWAQEQLNTLLALKRRG